MKRAGSAGFTFIELVVALGILSTLALSAAMMLTPQIAYFRVRGDAQRMLALLRDQQAQAAHSGFADAGARGGGVMFFQGHVVPDPASGSVVIDDEDAADAFSFMVCPVDYTTDPDRPRVRLPGGGSARRLSDLPQAELATVVNVAEGVLFRNGLTEDPIRSGDYILFAERDLDSGDGGLGPRPLDRGSAIFSSGFGTSREVVVNGPEARYTLTIDPGGFISAGKR